jgi:hypothetical protein
LEDQAKYKREDPPSITLLLSKREDPPKQKKEV